MKNIINGGLIGVQKFDEGQQTAFILELFIFTTTLIGQFNLHARVQERQFP